jgi:type IV secretory pathway VirB4 component
MRQLAMMVIANFVENTVKRRPKRRLLVVDEGWLLLQYDESARFIAGLTRRARKYHLGVAMISQQANDFLKSKYGQEIASQSALRILMRQDSTTVREVAAQFKLSEQEEKFISSCRTGEALVIKHQQHISLSVVASPSEHPLITTDPREKEE